MLQAALAKLDRIGISNKLSVDFIWNIASFGIIGSSGLLFTLLIVRYYQPEALGVFDQSYAIYIMISQLAVFGVHLSIAKYVAQHAAEQQIRRDILASAVYTVLLISTAATVVAWPASYLIESFLNSPDVGKSLRLIIPGLIIFSTNKVFTVYFNARREMKVFAVLGAGRALLSIGSILLMATYQVESYYLATSFVIADAILFFVVAPYLYIRGDLRLFAGSKAWMKKHTEFGSRIFAGNFAVDANSRIEVLILGVFLVDREVGLYSLAAFLILGFNEFATVFSNIVNPILTQKYYQLTRDEFSKAIRHGRNLFYLMMVPIGIIAVIAFPYIIDILKPDGGYDQAWLPFGIYMAGILTSIGYIPFRNLLSQTGKPGKQTILVSILLVFNVCLCFVLVPIWGIPGAAASAGITAGLHGLLLKWIAWKSLQLRI